MRRIRKTSRKDRPYALVDVMGREGLRGSTMEAGERGKVIENRGRGRRVGRHGG